MKFCVNCGSQIDDQSKFCKICGAAQPDISQFQGQMSPQGQQMNPQGQQMNPQMQQLSQEDIPTQAFFQDQTIPQNFTNMGTVPGVEPTLPPEKEKKSMSGLTIGLIVSAIVLLLMVGTFLVLVLTGVINFGKNDITDGPEGPGGIEASSTETEETTEGTTEVAQNPNSFDALNSALASKQSMDLGFVSSDVSEYPTVKLYYTVEDSAGETLLLTSPTAAVNETLADGTQVERTIKSVSMLEGNQGVSFSICADKSGSMDSDMDTMKQAMTDFVHEMDTNSGDKAELISFDSYIMYMCTFTQDKSLLQNGINNMVADGGTAFYDALYESVMNASTQEGARCVVAFTDGDDNESRHSYTEVIDYANSMNVPIFIIGTASGGGVYESIAKDTGGWFWSISSVSDMSEVLSEIYKMNKEMYCVSYETDGSIDQYSQRSVDCIISDETYGARTSATFTPVKPIEVAPHTSRYEVVKADVSWTEANQAAMQKGGHLVTITSQAEMDEVSGLCEAEGIKYVWMGGYTSVYGNSSFGHWVTGEDFNSYTAWYDGEPSRQDRDQVEEMYLMLWYVNDEWSWNDQRENVFDTGLKYFEGNVGYVIEYED